MIVLEIISLLSAVTIGILGSVSDIKHGIVKNKMILVFLIEAVIINVIYYGFLAQDIFLDFLINYCTILTIVFVMYFTHVWAGGDCKLMLVMALLYPARYYLPINGSIYTEIYIVGVAFVVAYLFVFGRSVFDLITGKITITGKSLVKTLKQTAVSFVISMAYICLIYVLYFKFLSQVLVIDDILLTLVFIGVAWLVNYVKVLRNVIAVIVVLVADVVLSIVFGIIPISTNPLNYLFVLVLVLMRFLTTSNKYDTVLAIDIEPGMILSTQSSVLLINSKKDLISGVSTENLKSRLSKEEATNINNWGYGTDYSLMVVKKTPFVLFIVIGFAIYFLLWGLHIW